MKNSKIQKIFIVHFHKQNFQINKFILFSIKIILQYYLLLLLFFL